MSRTLTAKVSTAVSDTVTAPRLLIYIGWSSAVRISTRETVTWNGYSWTASNGARVPDIAGANGQHRATIDLPNHDNAYGAIALSEGLHDIPVTIHALYGSSPYVAADAVSLFEGTMDGGVITPTWVSVQCAALRAVAMFAPRIYAQPPLCNHLAAAGLTLRWNGDNYLLERR